MVHMMVLFCWRLSGFPQLSRDGQYFSFSAAEATVPEILCILHTSEVSIYG